jgi:nucleoside 2-deoxyribosyltransferase
MSDPFESEEFQDFRRRVLREMLPKLKRSDVSLTIYSGEADVKLAVELGFAILLEKPIILCVDPDVVVGPRLRRVADRIVIGRLEDDELTDRLQAAISELLE